MLGFPACGFSTWIVQAASYNAGLRLVRLLTRQLAATRAKLEVTWLLKD